MKLATMSLDVIRSIFQHPATENYPSTRQKAPLRLRSYLEWDRQTCTGCGLCAMDCPADAIQVTILERKEKRFVMTYHVDRCLFCGQCVTSCRQGALRMVNDHWELAALDKGSFINVMGEEEDVAKVMAGSPAGGPATP